MTKLIQKSMEFLRKKVNATTEAVRAGVFDVVLSMSSADREGDRVFASGWKLPSSRSVPLLINHEHGKLPIGRVENLRVEGDRLLGRATFTPRGMNPLADQVSDLVEAGFMDSVSVGFQPLAEPKFNEFGGYDYNGQELLELSVVNVPAHPGARIQAGMLAAVQKWLDSATDEDTTDVRILVDPEQVEAAIARAFKANPDAIRVDMDSVDRAVRAGIQRGFATHGPSTEPVVTIDDEVLDGLIRDAITHAIQQRTGRLQ